MMPAYAQGELVIAKESSHLFEKNLGILEQGDLVSVESLLEPRRFLLISEKPLNEPVVQGGSFVMNTHDEIKQAFDDFKQNRF